MAMFLNCCQAFYSSLSFVGFAQVVTISFGN